MDREKRMLLYKEFYFFELSRRDTLNQSVGLPVGVVVVLLGSLGYYLRNFSPAGSIHAVLFYTALIAGSVALLMAVGFLVAATWRHRYYSLPTVDTLAWRI